METDAVPCLKTPRCAMGLECEFDFEGHSVAGLGSLTSKCLSDAFPSTDRGFQFARRAACRVSLGPLDHSGSEAGTPGTGEDGSLSPLLPFARWGPIDSCSKPASKSPCPASTQEPEDFAQQVLLSCRKIAREARNLGPNLYDSDSSASPIKRKVGSSSLGSPTKRRHDVNHLWEPVYSRRHWKGPDRRVKPVLEFQGFEGLDEVEAYLQEVDGVDGTEGL